jgi:ferrous iron transport protein A
MITTQNTNTSSYQKRQTANIPLTQLQEEQETIIASIDGGHMAQGKLARMGILPGSIIKIIKKTKRGPMIVEVKGVRLAVGRGMLSKIIVSPIGNKQQSKQ